MAEQLSEESVRRIIQEEFALAFQKVLGIQSKEYVNGINACKILGCSVPTLWKYTQLGSIRKYRFGGDPKYKVSELLQLQSSGLIKHRSKSA